jgi:hypothetical protein
MATTAPRGATRVPADRAGDHSLRWAGAARGDARLRAPASRPVAVSMRSPRSRESAAVVLQAGQKGRIHACQSELHKSLCYKALPMHGRQFRDALVRCCNKSWGYAATVLWRTRHTRRIDSIHTSRTGHSVLMDEHTPTQTGRSRRAARDSVKPTETIRSPDVTRR